MEFSRLGFALTLAFLALSHTSSNPVTSISNDLIDFNSDECGTPLHKAVANGTSYNVDIAVERGTNLYELDCKGLSAMHLAISLDKLEMIKALIENDFDVNYQFKNGDTVLYHAIKLGIVDAAATLISYGSNVNMVNYEGSTPLLEALVLNNKDVIDLLVANNATYKVQFPNGDTCLHKAAESGNVRKVLLLIKFNFTIDQMNKKGETALTKAATHNHPAVVNILLSRGANSNFRSTSGETIIYQTVMSKSLGGLRALLAFGIDPSIVNNDKYSTPLLASSKVNFREAAELLVQYQADLKGIIAEKNGMNLLHLATRYGDPASLKWLVEMGLNVNSATNQLWTSLHFAAVDNSVEAAKVLIGLNACRSCRTSDGKTPADLATTPEMKNLLRTP